MSSVTGHAHGKRRGEVVDEIGTGQHRDDAGHRGRGGRVDRDDASVRDRAADDAHVQRAGQVEVVDEAGLAGEERRVLLAQCRDPEHAGAGAGDRGHRPPPALSAAASTALTMLW